MRWRSWFAQGLLMTVCMVWFVFGVKSVAMAAKPLSEECSNIYSGGSTFSIEVQDLSDFERMVALSQGIFKSVAERMQKAERCGVEFDPDSLNLFERVVYDEVVELRAALTPRLVVVAAKGVTIRSRPTIKSADKGELEHDKVVFWCGGKDGGLTGPDEGAKVEWYWFDYDGTCDRRKDKLWVASAEVENGKHFRLVSWADYGRVNTVCDLLDAKSGGDVAAQRRLRQRLDESTQDVQKAWSPPITIIGCVIGVLVVRDQLWKIRKQVRRKYKSFSVSTLMLGIGEVDLAPNSRVGTASVRSADLLQIALMAAIVSYVAKQVSRKACPGGPVGLSCSVIETAVVLFGCWGLDHLMDYLRMKAPHAIGQVT